MGAKILLKNKKNYKGEKISDILIKVQTNLKGYKLSNRIK